MLKSRYNTVPNNTRIISTATQPHGILLKEKSEFAEPPLIKKTEPPASKKGKSVVGKKPPSGVSKESPGSPAKEQGKGDGQKKPNAAPEGGGAK